jgi:succinoglycan biosynthesis protein ExoM
VSGAAPLRVCVGILTFRRPAQLAALLPQVLDQLRDLASDPGLPGASGEVLVVDNDPGRSAEQVCARFAQRVRYVHEPAPGIAAGRHRAVAEAGAARLLQFIDDDEEPADGWLAGMVRTWLEEDRPAAVAGSVRPRFAREPSSWIRAGGFFDRRQLATGTAVAVAPAGNLLLDLHQVRALGVRFDPSLGLRGGEDSLFTDQLTRAGGRIVFCREAAIHDLVPPERSTRAWVLERSWHRGNTDSFLALHESRPGPGRAWLRLRLLAGGLARLLVGSARAGAGLASRSERHHARGLRLAYKGRGMLRGAVGSTDSTAPQYVRPGERS